MSKPALTLLGFDYGTQKIGVAVGQTITSTASSLCILNARDGIPDWPKIEALLNEWQPDALVIGIPYNMDGSESPMSIKAQKFGRRLNGRFNLPCHEIDERLTSREAREISRSNAELSGRRQSSRKAIDNIAAQLILASWLAENS